MKPELGQYVVAKRDFQIYRVFGNVTQKISDVRAGMRGVVCGFNGDEPIVNIIAYSLVTSIEPFDDFWQWHLPANKCQ